MGEKGEGFARTIIKDTWTITRGCGNSGGRWGGLGWWGGLGGKGRKLYLNNNKKMLKKKKEVRIPYKSSISLLCSQGLCPPDNRKSLGYIPLLLS